VPEALQLDSTASGILRVIGHGFHGFLPSARAAARSMVDDARTVLVAVAYFANHQRGMALEAAWYGIGRANKSRYGEVGHADG
jgi:hypothetical protein